MKSLNLILSSLLVFPLIASANLSSENFSVVNDVISADAITSNGSSATYNSQQTGGGVYVYGDAVIAPVINQTQTLTQSTQTDYWSRIASNFNETLTAQASILVCHDNYGSRFAAAVNVKVFVSILEYGKLGNSGGHETHALDIVPSFSYDFGEGVKKYDGHNWTTENQELHKNNCEKYLQFSPQTSTENSSERTTDTTDTASVPSVPTNQQNPVIEPISICKNKSTSKEIITAINDQTLLTVRIPDGALRPKNNISTSSVFFQISPVPSALYQPRSEQLVFKMRDTSVVAATIPRYIVPDSHFASLAPNLLSYEPVCDRTLEDTGQNGPDTSVVPSEILAFTNPGNSWTDLIGSSVTTKQLALLTTPFSISVKSREGENIKVFSKPIELRIFSAAIESVKDTIYVMKPSADNTTWFEVPFSFEKGELIIKTETPGEFYIWYLTPASEAAAIPAKQNAIWFKYIDETLIPAALVLLISLALIILLIARKRYFS